MKSKIFPPKIIVTFEDRRVSKHPACVKAMLSPRDLNIKVDKMRDNYTTTFITIFAPLFPTEFQH